MRILTLAFRLWLVLAKALSYQQKELASITAKVMIVYYLQIVKRKISSSLGSFAEDGITSLYNDNEFLFSGL
jgi:hypothetical protein